MTADTILAMPLNQAFLCANCEFVGNQSERCQKCAGTQFC